MITAQSPPFPVLAAVQVMHQASTFGLAQVGTMGLMVHHVPPHVMARGQGFLAACAGHRREQRVLHLPTGVVYARPGAGRLLCGGRARRAPAQL